MSTPPAKRTRGPRRTTPTPPTQHITEVGHPTDGDIEPTEAEQLTEVPAEVPTEPGPEAERDLAHVPYAEWGRAELATEATRLKAEHAALLRQHEELHASREVVLGRLTSLAARLGCPPDWNDVMQTVEDLLSVARVAAPEAEPNGGTYEVQFADSMSTCQALLDLVTDRGGVPHSVAPDRDGSFAILISWPQG